ncbi:right-handed parallel beta-helix repeat-containing protein [Clostridium autoethanogenum]|uniref:Right-handed parallel beta-helix repeat-containing protein n=1 Tax=Clostridium autoethanogenum DSM 10061 TaxID=1341692 RepID=A0ABM5NZJ7_9CLOT|nr:NosD domain-containing protein [Clostridium autoethanogenum]AGY77998.1 right-handed parallel beta-helix repeat-containing protein [Clostridium autoethanogenum DSM 10061]ALU38132.1 Hypothetical protein CLAU_3705 [Clostridium autoethanogenum DSM 10061]OVY50896.1 hypothetical protein WX72_02057 [Clostridium autoethanogenum]
MATTTESLQLYKAENIDGSNTFNIKTILNDNWDKLDADSKLKNENISGINTSVNKITRFVEPSDIDTVQDIIDNMTVNGGGTIIFSPGIYFLSKGLNMKSDVHLKLSQGAILKVKDQFKTTLTVAHTAHTYTLTVADVSGFKMGQQICYGTGATGYLPGIAATISSISGNVLTVTRTNSVETNYEKDIPVENSYVVVATSAIYCHQVTNSSITGGEIDGNKAKVPIYTIDMDTGFNGIILDYTNNFTIEDVYVHDFNFQGIHPCGSNENLILNRVRAEYCLSSGICVDSCLDGTIIKNSSANYNSVGVQIISSDNFRLENVKCISNNYSGVELSNSYANHNFVIEQLDSEQNNQYGIRLSNAINGTVKGLTLKSNKVAGIHVENTNTCLVDGGIIEDSPIGIEETANCDSNRYNNIKFSSIANKELDLLGTNTSIDGSLEQKQDITVGKETITIGSNIVESPLAINAKGRYLKNLLGNLGNITTHQSEYSTAGMYGGMFSIWLNSLVKTVDGFACLDGYFSDFTDPLNAPRCSYIRFTGTADYYYLIMCKAKGHIQLTQKNVSANSTIKTTGDVTESSWTNVGLLMDGSALDMYCNFCSGYVTYNNGYYKDIMVIPILKSNVEGLTEQQIINKYINSSYFDYNTSSSETTVRRTSNGEQIDYTIPCLNCLENNQVYDEIIYPWQLIQRIGKHTISGTDFDHLESGTNVDYIIIPSTVFEGVRTFPNVSGNTVDIIGMTRCMATSKDDVSNIGQYYERNDNTIALIIKKSSFSDISSVRTSYGSLTSQFVLKSEIESTINAVEGFIKPNDTLQLVSSESIPNVIVTLPLNNSAAASLITNYLDYIRSSTATNTDKIDNHIADNTKQIPHLGTTTNSGDAYSIETSEVINTNEKFTITFNNPSTTAPTLSINGGTAHAIKKQNGNNAKLYASNYMLFWNGSNFQLLGEGGDYGTATSGDVLETKTFGTEDGIKQGSIPICGAGIDAQAIAKIVSNGKAYMHPPEGTYFNGGSVYTSEPDLSSDNIKAGKKVFGIDGKSSVVDTADATATATQIRNGQTAYVNGNKVTGSCPVQATSAQTVTPGTSDIVKPAGIYDDNITIKGDSNLSSNNIISGKSIFGISGSATIESLGGLPYEYHQIDGTYYNTSHTYTFTTSFSKIIFIIFRYIDINNYYRILAGGYWWTSAQLYNQSTDYWMSTTDPIFTLSQPNNGSFTLTKNSSQAFNIIGWVFGK